MLFGLGELLLDRHHVEISPPSRLALFDVQGKVEVMETVSGAKEEVARAAVVDIVAKRLQQLGPLQLVVPGRPTE